MKMFKIRIHKKCKGRSKNLTESIIFHVSQSLIQLKLYNKKCVVSEALKFQAIIEVLKENININKLRKNSKTQTNKNTFKTDTNLSTGTIISKKLKASCQLIPRSAIFGSETSHSLSSWPNDVLYPTEVYESRGIGISDVYLPNSSTMIRFLAKISTSSCKPCRISDTIYFAYFYFCKLSWICQCCSNPWLKSLSQF